MNKEQKQKMAVGFLPSKQIGTPVLKQLSGIMSGSKKHAHISYKENSLPT